MANPEDVASSKRRAVKLSNPAKPIVANPNSDGIILRNMWLREKVLSGRRKPVIARPSSQAVIKADPTTNAEASSFLVAVGIKTSSEIRIENA